MGYKIGSGIREKDVQSHSGDKSPRVRRNLGGGLLGILNRG